MHPHTERLINDDTRKVLKKEFGRLKEPVTVFVFTSEKENQPFNEFAKKLLNELSEISDKIKPTFGKIGEKLSQQHRATRSPTLLVQPDTYKIRFIGAPAAEEAQTLMVALLMTSTGKTILSENSRKRLQDLKDKRSIKVFVSPT